MQKKIFIFLFFLWFSCSNFDDTISSQDAYSHFYIAILYKASQCNQKPEFLMILPKEISKKIYEACIFSIIRMDCPFNEYPLICYKIYEKSD
ncbi:MAG: hypothetical protein ACK4UJ_07350 [Leptonema sp. (in: bacteria)]